METFSGVTNRTSPSGNLLNKSGFAGCQGSGSCLTALYSLYSLGEGVLAYCFSGLGLSPLVPVKGTLYAPADQDILDYFMIPTLFGDGPFLSQHDLRTSAQIKAYKDSG